MKTLTFLLFLVMCVLQDSNAQTLNQLTIIPVNPDSTDSITVIADFSYNGNCAFGMTYNYTYVAGDTIIMMPTYCGFGDTSSCNSIDTMQIGPFPAGNYLLRVEFHQGSVCPISGFDATLLTFDTTLTVTIPVGIMNAGVNPVRVFPNPASEKLFIELGEIKEDNKIRMLSISGQVIFETTAIQNSMEIDLKKSNISKGLYILDVVNGDDAFSQKVVVE
jgi:hypothetical protein